MLDPTDVRNKAYSSPENRSTVSDDRTTPKPENPEGGQGGALLADEKRVRGDRKLLGRAIRAGWNIPEAMKDKAVRVVDSLLESDHAKLQTEGVKLLTVMNAQNQADDALEAKFDRLDEGKPTDVVFVCPPPRVIGGTGDGA